jgi:tRNA-specific 2-thiouridylase
MIGPILNPFDGKGKAEDKHDSGPFFERKFRFYPEADNDSDVSASVSLEASLFWHCFPEAGSTVLLISPAICSPREIYFNLALRLAAEYPVIVYDHRAHSRSTGDFDVEMCAQDLEAILSNLNEKGLKTIVIGHSFGGMLAGIAAGRGAKAEALVLMATPPNLVSTERKVPKSVSIMFLYLYNLIRAARSIYYLSYLVRNRLLMPWQFFKKPQLYALAPVKKGSWRKTWKKVLKSVHEGPGIQEYADKIREQKIPVKFIWGSMDSTHGLSKNNGCLPEHFNYVHKIVKSNPHAELKIIPDLSHYMTKKRKSGIPIASDNSDVRGQISAFISKICTKSSSKKTEEKIMNDNDAPIGSLNSSAKDSGKDKKYYVALSGGIDSTISAWLCKETGADVRAGVLLFDVPDTDRPAQDSAKDLKKCGGAKALEGALKSAEQLGIELDQIHCSERFKENIYDFSVDSYSKGLTPNPCALCNIYLKFGTLAQKAVKQGRTFVTGHYVRLYNDKSTGKHFLQRGNDSIKDQSYFLAGIDNSLLENVYFPLGSMSKPKVKEIGADLGLKAVDRPESQDLCFGIETVFSDNLKKNRPGNFILADNRVIGKHRGMGLYTIGQRKGLGVSWSEPLYVIEIRAETNEIVLGTGKEVFSENLTAELASWHGIPGSPEFSAPDNIPDEFSAMAQVRYRSRAFKCKVTWDRENKTFHLDFEKPQRAVTPGQLLVLYDVTDQYVCAAAWIK